MKISSCAIKMLTKYPIRFLRKILKSFVLLIWKKAFFEFENFIKPMGIIKKDLKYMCIIRE